MYTGDCLMTGGKVTDDGRTIHVGQDPTIIGPNKFNPPTWNEISKEVEEYKQKKEAELVEKMLNQTTVLHHEPAITAKLFGITVVFEPNEPGVQGVIRMSSSTFAELVTRIDIAASKAGKCLNG